MSYLIISFGQDGYITAQKLYKMKIPFMVLARRSQSVSEKLNRSPHLKNFVVYSEIIDISTLIEIKKTFGFEEILNFAANSFVQDSITNFKSYVNNNSSIVWEILKFLQFEPSISYFHPLSSEILSDSANGDFKPRNSYGLGKLIDYHSCRISAETHSLNICTCIMFNHESKYRPDQFFTKKIIKGLFDKSISTLNIYNSKSYRDWGYAPEFIDLILNRPRSNGFQLTQLGTGFSMTVEDFVDHAFNHMSLDFEKNEVNGLLRWRSATLNINEQSRDIKDASRIKVAECEEVKKSFKRLPDIHTSSLVRQLMDDFGEQA